VKVGGDLPGGWTFREVFPFYDGPFPEFVLEHEDGREATVVIDRAMLTPGGSGFRYLHEWVVEITGQPIAWRTHE
jgi:hypothetical protein